MTKGRVLEYRIMIMRKIEIFRKKDESYVRSVTLNVDFDALAVKYSFELKDDPKLYYDYVITKEDVNFFKKIIDIDFDFEKYDYFLTCMESND